MIIDGDSIDFSNPNLPSTIPNLTLWLDATSGLFNQVVGGSSVTANNNRVMRWEDKSGNNYHLTAINGNTIRAPVLRTNSLNNTNTIFFSGGQAATSTALSSIPITQNLISSTCFFVFNTPASEQTYSGNAKFLLCVGQTYTNRLAWPPPTGRIPTDAGNARIFFGYSDNGAGSYEGGISNFTTEFKNKWVIYSTRHTGSSAIITNVNNSVLMKFNLIRRNNEAYNFSLSAESCAGQAFQLANRTVLPVGASYSNCDRAFDGNVAEILVYDSALTDQQMGYIEIYLAKKWGFEANGF